MRACSTRRHCATGGLVRPRCFLGFYLDLSAFGLTPDANHTLTLELPQLSAGAFEGAFLENVDTTYTSAISMCRVTVPF